MKKYKFCFQILALILVANLNSCVEIDENYKEYLESGAISYTTKADSVDVFVGHNRIQLSPYVTNAFSVTEFVVSWNDGEDSQTFPFTKSGNSIIDNPPLIISGLDEKTYGFVLYSKDNAGNESLKKDIFAASYGDRFIESLTTRSVVSYSFDGTDGTINWLASDDLERGSEIKYTDQGGTEVTLEIPEGEATTKLPNLDVDKAVSIISFYVPTAYDPVKEFETSIDEFPSASVSLTIPEELKTILGTVTTSPVLEGIEVNWTNATNLSVNIKVEYTVNGELQTKTFDRSEDTDGVFIVKGLENGMQDVKILVTNQSGSGIGSIFSVEPISIFLLDKSAIIPLILPFDAGEGCHGSSYARILDGATGEFWHSCGDSTDQYPFVMSFDLGAQANLAKFKLDKRSSCCGGRSPAEMQFWGTNDITLGDTADIDAGTLADWEADATAKGWVKIGGFEGNTDETLTKEVTGTETYRYLRLVYVSSIDGDTTANFDELTFWSL